MSTYRIALVGTLMLLGACSMAPTRPHSAGPMATVAVPPPPPVPAVMAPPPAPAPVPAPAPPAHASVTPAPLPPPRRAVPRSTHKAPVKEKVEAPALAAPAPAELQLSGHVDMTGSRGQQVVAGELADTLVYFVPAKGARRIKPGHYTVYTHNRDFSPEAMAVPQGSTVTFVNLDDVRHNVFSVTPGAAFNLGYQGAGEKISHAFTHAGIVLVSCNVHHSMELDLLVLPTPYSGKVAADGSFTLRGLPAGPGTLYFWNSRALLASQPVTLPMTGAVAQRMLAIKPRMSTELNTGGSP